MDFLYSKRHTDSFFHISMARNWLKMSKNSELQSPITYAALEYRLACERVLFELYLLLIDPQKFNLEKEKRNLQSTNSLMSAIHRVGKNNGQLKLAQIFNQYYASLLWKDVATFSIIDAGLIHGYWNKLSTLCHMQVEPSDTWESQVWISKQYDLIVKIDHYFSTILNTTNSIGWIPLDSLPHQVLEVRKSFLNREISETSMKTRINLVFNTLKGLDDFKKSILLK